MGARWIYSIPVVAILTVSSAGRSTPGEAATAAEPKGPPVLSGCERDYPPYSIVREDGQADGFSVELLRAALKAVGREVTFKTGLWEEIKQDLADGRLQVLPQVGRTPEREAAFDFTFPYLTMQGTIVVRKDNEDIHAPEDLKGKRVAVLQGDNAEEYLRRASLGAVIVPLPSFETALRELSAGRHDAVVIQKLVAFQLMQGARIQNLRTAGPPLKDFTQSFCFAVRKGDSALLAELNEGLAIAMADGTFRNLRAKWFAPIEALGRTKSRIVVGGDNNYPPYEFLDPNGQPAGYTVDLTRAIARRMGLQVEVRLGPWGRIRKELASGQIDLLQGMFYSVDRDREFDLSPAHTSVEHGIVVRQGSPEPADMKDLAGKSILVMSGDIMEDLAVKLGYGKQILAVESQEEALRLLAAGKHDCALVAMVPALYWIEKNGWRNLSVSTHSVLSAEYCYAVLHGRDELLAQFSQGLAAISTTGEYRQIRAKWLSPYEEAAPSYRTFARHALLTVIALLILLGGSLLWSRSLKRQVEGRTRELAAKGALLEAQSEELFRSREMLWSVLDGVPQRVFWKDRHSVYLGCNKPFSLDMGCDSADEVVGKTDDDAPWKAYAAQYRADDHAVITTGAPKYNIDEPLKRADGQQVWLKTSKVPLHDKDGNVIGVLGTYEDITEQKRAAEEITLLAHALRSVEECVSITDANDTILFVNEAFVKTYGYDEGELIGKRIDILRTSENRVSATAEILPATIGGGWKGELLNRRKDGSEFPIVLSTSVVRDDTGQAVALIGVSTDITEKRNAEEALRQRAETLERAIADLERFNRLSVGRELRMVDLKKEVNALSVELGGPAPYPLDFLSTEVATPGRTGKDELEDDPLKGKRT